MIWKMLVAPSKASRRFLSLQEYQAKKLLQDYSLPVQPFFTVTREDLLSTFNSSGTLPVSKLDSLLGSIDEDEGIKLSNSKLVIKAQALTGSRGKGYVCSSLDRNRVFLKGGVHLIPFYDSASCSSLTTSMLATDSCLVTPQAPEGAPIEAVMVAKSVDILSERYLSMTLTRQSGIGPGIRIIVSTTGGTEIEEEAKEGQLSTYVLPLECLDREIESYTTWNIVNAMELEDRWGVDEQAHDIVLKLLRLFRETDVTMLEINPLSVIAGHSPLSPPFELMCVDCKMSIDEAAMFRQAKISDLLADRIAVTDGGGIVTLGGSVGCLVNGAGLAMATMDMLSLHNTKPANFLDIGGAATVDVVTRSLRSLLGSAGVKSVWVNIFGGIVKGDVVARGIIEALSKGSIAMVHRKPVVVRMVGSQWELGKEMLCKAENKLIYWEQDFERAAQLAMLLAQEEQWEKTRALAEADQEHKVERHVLTENA